MNAELIATLERALALAKGETVTTDAAAGTGAAVAPKARFPLTIEGGQLPPAWDSVQGDTQAAFIAYLGDQSKPEAVSVSTALVSYANEPTTSVDAWDAVRRARLYMAKRVAGDRLTMPYRELVPFLVQEHIDAERGPAAEGAFLPGEGGQS